MTQAEGAETRKEKYGKDFHARIGALGGKKSSDKPKGMAYMKIHDPKRFAAISARGGKKSKRKAA